MYLVIYINMSFFRMPSFKQKHNSVRLPQRQSRDSCGYDFFLPSNITLKPQCTVKIDSGVKAILGSGEFLMLKLRSSFCDRLSLLGGVIDGDFDETIKILLLNITDKDILLPKLTRVVQGIILQYLVTDGDECRTEIRKGGFGSTGGGITTSGSRTE